MKKQLLIFIACFSITLTFAQEKKYYVNEIIEIDLIQNYAKIYEVAPDSIKKWNKLSSDTLKPKMKIGVYNYNDLSQEVIALNTINYKLNLIRKAKQSIQDEYDNKFKELEDEKSTIDANEAYAMQKYIDISKSKHELKENRDQKLVYYKQLEIELELFKKRLLDKQKTKSDDLKQNSISVKDKQKKVIEKKKNKKDKHKKADKEKKNKSITNINKVEETKDKNEGYDLTYLEFDTQIEADTSSKKYKKAQTKLAKNADINELSNEEMKQVIIDEVEVKNKKEKFKIGDEVNAVRRDKAKFYLSRAMMEIDKQDLKKANSYIDKSLKLNPSYTEAYMLKGDILAKVGLYNKAIKEYEHASILNGTLPQLYYNMGNCYIFLGKKSKAIEMMSLALDVDSTYVLAYSGRSSLYIQKGEYKKALRDYSSLLDINKYFYPALKGRGICYYKVGEYDKSIRDFNKLLEYEDNDPSIYYHRAFAKLYNSEIYGSCMDFLKASKRGYSEADKAIKKYCD